MKSHYMFDVGSGVWNGKKPLGDMSFLAQVAHTFPYLLVVQQLLLISP